jgi:hypothetical protein
MFARGLSGFVYCYVSSKILTEYCKNIITILVIPDTKKNKIIET